MNKIPIGMKTGWWSFGLLQSLPTEWWKTNRNRYLRSTYELMPYEFLPPVQISLDDNFEWLQSQPIKKDALTSQGNPLDEFLKISQKVRLTLPASLTTFVKREELHQRIRSNTCCDIIACSYSKTNYGYLIPFLSDSQGCVYWHIHLNDHNQYFIAASLNEYGFLNGAGKPYFDEQIDLEKADIWYCAPTLSEFMYRFWIENEIWFTLEGKHPLMPIEQAYFDDFLNALNGRPTQRVPDWWDSPR